MNITANFTGLASAGIQLVDKNGNNVSEFSAQTWGVTYRSCETACNGENVPIDFNFPNFASSITNYFLPWIALCAQLPYETGDNYSNVMSFFLAVGSPALVTYSLTVTILNRYWVRGKFNKLFDRALSTNVRSSYPEMHLLVRAAQFVLQEIQQVPIRLSQEDGWLSSLIVLPENLKWWINARKKLKDTRREVTPSLVAQIFLAFVAYLFTVIASFITSVGDMGVALDISSGSLWLWLIPVIWGWVLVGTQIQPKGIDDALKHSGATRALEPPIMDGVHTVKAGQRGIVSRSGLTPQPHGNQTNEGGFETHTLDYLDIPTWNGADVGGDERRHGPIYNYAKLFTWSEVARVIEQAISTELDQIENDKAVEQDAGQNKRWDPLLREGNLRGDGLAVSRYCGLSNPRTRMKAYPTRREIPGEVWKRLLAACVMAVFVQAGTTGPSILIAYLTPTVGLGCRSGGYLLYGCLGIFVWICLLTSALLSHWAMLLYQDKHILSPSTDFREPYRNGDDPETNAAASGPSAYTRTWKHSSICAAAVLLRYTGKTVAVLNGLWLIVSTLLEYTGVYDNCWCKSDRLGKGDTGWVVLFKGASDLKQAANSSWAAGVATSLLVCSISLAIFYLGCSDQEASD
ncbi:hypothetical protein AAFC00_006635 [Neodothiora populina]